MSPLAAIVWGNSYDYTVLGNSLYLVKGFTKCLKIVKLFSITGLCLWWIWHSRVFMASWFCSKYFLQSRDSLTFSFQIGHREVFSLWGKNPIDYRESHFYIQPDWKSWENFDHESVRPTEYGPAQSCLPFWQIAIKAARCNFDRRGFLRGTPYTWSFVLFQRKQSIVWVSVCVCCYNFCSKETMTKVVPFKLALVCFANDYIGLVVF